MADKKVVRQALMAIANMHNKHPEWVNECVGMWVAQLETKTNDDVTVRGKGRWFGGTNTKEPRRWPSTWQRAIVRKAGTWRWVYTVSGAMSSMDGTTASGLMQCTMEPKSSQRYPYSTGCIRMHMPGAPRSSRMRHDTVAACSKPYCSTHRGMRPEAGASNAVQIDTISSSKPRTCPH